MILSNIEVIFGAKKLTYNSFMQSGQKLRRKFNKIIKEIDNENTKEHIRVLRDQVFAKFEKMLGEIKLRPYQNRKTVAVEERKLNMVEYTTANIKATYRPETGELLIKVPINTPDWKREILKTIGEKIIAELPVYVKMTLRGDVRWSDSNRGFSVTLKDNDRKVYAYTFKTYAETATI